MMTTRRIIFAAALLSVGCYNPSAFTTTNTGAARIVVTSDVSSQGLFVGDQVQLTAYPVDASGAVVSGAISYSSSSTAVATITQTGLISAVGAGNTVIVLTSGAVIAQYPLAVDGNVSGSAVIGPNTATVKVGAQQLFTPVVLTTNGNPAKGKTVTWSSSDLTRATVDATGRATAIATTAGVSICATVADNSTVKGCGILVITP
jgi:uncharacterized protein YjdB